MDVKLAYLYGQLSDDKYIYMRPLSGIKLSSMKDNQVPRLYACLYGLKQTRRWWAKKFYKVTTAIGLTCLEHDYAIFYCYYLNGEILVIAISVDNMTMTDPNITQFKD